MSKALTSEDIKETIKGFKLHIVEPFEGELRINGEIRIRCPFTNHKKSSDMSQDSMYIYTAGHRRFACPDCQSYGKLTDLFNYLGSTDRSDWKPL